MKYLSIKRKSITLTAGDVAMEGGGAVARWGTALQAH